MNISNLQVGQVIKNYKELCNVLGIKTTTGGAKQNQIKELELYCNIERKGYKYIIKEIYKNPTITINDINRFIVIDSFNVDINKYNNTGIYYILKDNDIYIGSTIQGFRRRFIRHYNKNNKNIEVYNMLHTGGTFNILYDTTCVQDECLIRNLESEYINYFINYTDLNVINIKTKGVETYKKNKIKYRHIKIKEADYQNAINKLKESNIDYKVLYSK